MQYSGRARSSLKASSNRTASRLTLRLGTCLGGAAAFLLAGTPVRASEECGPLTLTTVTCPASGAYEGGVTYVIGDEMPPQDLTVRLGDGLSLETDDDYVNGITVTNFSGGATAIIADGASSVTTHGGGSIGIAGITGAGDLTIHAGDVTTSGGHALGVVAGSVSGNIDVDLGSVTTRGDYADGVTATGYSGNINVSVGKVETEGFNANGIFAASVLGDVAVKAGEIAVYNDYSSGIFANSDQGSVSVDVGTVTVGGNYAAGIYASGSAGTSVHVDSLSTVGAYAYGVIAATTGSGDTRVDAGSISTGGVYGTGIIASSLGGNTAVIAGSVSTQGMAANGIVASAGHNVSVDAGQVVTTGNFATGIAATAGLYQPGTATITAGTVETHGMQSDAVFGRSWNGDVVIDAGTVSTTGMASAGIVGVSYGGTGGISIMAGSVSTSGLGGTGIAAASYGDVGKVAIKAGSIATSGNYADAIYALSVHGDITIEADEIATEGYISDGIYAVSGGGNITIAAGSVSTQGGRSDAVFAEARQGVLDITVDGTISTSGSYSSGIVAVGEEVKIVNKGTIHTSGDYYSYGIAALSGDSGLTITNDGTIASDGAFGGGIIARSSGDITIDGKGSVSVGSLYSNGIDARTQYGSIAITQSKVDIDSDFGTGIYARSGKGNVDIAVSDLNVTGYAAAGIVGISGTGDVTVTSTGSIKASHDYGHLYGIVAIAGGTATVAAHDIAVAGPVSYAIRADGGSAVVSVTGTITSRGDLYGPGAAITAVARDIDGKVTVTSKGAIATTGKYNGGIMALAGFEPGEDGGIAVHASGAVSTKGLAATAIYASALNGHVEVTAGDVSTQGDFSAGVKAFAASGGVNVALSGAVRTNGRASYGVLAFGEGPISVSSSGAVATQGLGAHGIYAVGGATSGTTVTVRTSGAISAKGDLVNAIRAKGVGGDVSVIATGAITAEGKYAGGVVAVVDRQGRGGDRPAASFRAAESAPVLTVDVGQVSVSGEGSTAVTALNYQGDITIRTGKLTAVGGGAGLSALGAGDVSIVNGGVVSDARGILARARGDMRLTLTGNIDARNDVAIELGSDYGASVLDIAKGVTVIGGGQHEYEGAIAKGNALILGSQRGVTVNNAGLIRNMGDQFTIFVGNVTDWEPTSVPAGTFGATINNTGVIEGSVRLTSIQDAFVNAGQFVATRDSDFGSGRDVFTNSGSLVVAPEVAQLRAGQRVTGGGTITFKGLDLFENSGVIEMRNGFVGDKLVIEGDYVGSGNARLGLDIGKMASDMLVVEGDARGHTSILLDGKASEATLFAPVTLVRVEGKSAADTFSIARPDVGLIRYTLTHDTAAGTYGLAGRAGAPVHRAVKLGEGARAICDQAAQAWSGHMAQLRDDTASGTRLWEQAYGSVLDRDQSVVIDGDDYALDYRQDFFGFQMGVDLAGSQADGGNGTVFGVSAGYVSSRQNFAEGGDRAKFDTVNLGGYGSLRSGAFYANLLGQYAHHWIGARSIALGWSDRTTGDGYGVQGEIGVRLGTDAFLIEPQASLAWQKDDLGALQPFGQALGFGRGEGLTGRIGARVGGKLGRAATFYAKGAWVHEFRGEGKITLTSGGLSETVDGMRPSDYGQAALGVTILSGGPVSGFVEGNAVFGNNVSGGGGRAGVRFAF